VPADLKQAHDVGGENGLRLGVKNVRDLPLAQPLGHLGLRHVIGPGGTAADFALDQRHEL
jgi:hypothetical protein